MAADSASYLDDIFLGDFDDVRLDDLGVRSEDGLVKPHDAAKLWQPQFLRRRVLTGFLLFYLALILALAALFCFSESHQGLVTAPQRNYLLWQYGPTAVFTLIAAFWGQVEYRAKQVAPWKLMAQGPQPAERSLLLDFVSPVSFVSLYKSLKMPGTRFVAVAITGGIVIELITVLSTGIFLLQPVPVDHLHLTNALDDFGGVNSTVFDPAKVDGRAATRVYAIRYNQAPYPSGTSPDYAFQNVITTNAPPDATTMTVNVNIFHPDISCEPLVVESIRTKLLTSHGTYEPLHYRLWSENDGMFTITTEVNRKSPAPFGGMYPVVNESYFVAHVGVSDNANTDSSSLLSSKVSGVLCKAGYGISSGMIRIDLGTSHTSVVDVTNTSDARPSQLPGVSAENLLLAVSDQLEWAVPLNFTEQLQAVLNNRTVSDIVSDSNLLVEGAEKLYKSTAAQLANIYFTKPTTQPLRASITVMEGRLVLQQLTFGLIQGLLISLVCLTAAMLALKLKASAPCDPGSIGGLATILARSPDLLLHLRGTGSSALSMLQRNIGYGRTWRTEVVSTAIGKEFRITEKHGLDLADYDSSAVSPESEAVTWFRPFTVRPIAKLSFSITIIVIVCVLESSYRFSCSHDGLIDLDPSEEYTSYAFTYIPTAALVAICLLFASLDFNVRVFQPAHVLRYNATRTTARGALHQDYLGKVGLHCLFSSVRHRHLPVSASSLGIVLAPFLTIVVSGLFHSAQIADTVQIQLAQLSSFVRENTSYIAFHDQHGNVLDEYRKGFSFTNLMLMDNMSEPLFTYNTLAFPRLQALPPTGSVDSMGIWSTGDITARVPAVRGRANCTVMEAANIVYQAFLYDPEFSGADVVRLSAKSTPGCGTLDEQGSEYLAALNNEDIWGGPHDRPAISVPAEQGKYFGALLALRNDEDWCYQSLAVFGQVSLGKIVENLTVVGCKPFLESVDTDTTFLANDFSLDLSSGPPTPIETTAHPIQDADVQFAGGGLWADLVPDRVLHSQKEFSNLAYPLFGGAAAPTARPHRSEPIADEGPVLRAEGGHTSSWPAHAAVDGFFAALLEGADVGAPAASLAGPANHAALLAAIDGLYGRVVAQLLNAGRFPPRPGAYTPLVNATLVAPNRVRLRQSGPSTRALEALLLALLVCLAVTHASMRSGRVLPANPCCVAAVASLLADAEMLRTMPRGAEWLGRGARERLFGGYVVSMGWWEDGGFGIDIGRAEGEREREGESAGVE